MFAPLSVSVPLPVFVRAPTPATIPATVSVVDAAVETVAAPGRATPRLALRVKVAVVARVAPPASVS